MEKKYLAKIIAKDTQGLQLISAICFKAEIKPTEIKYLQKNKIFLLSMLRFRRETKDTDVKINSICKFEFVDTVKSKNIEQTDKNLVLKLMNIDLLKNKNNYEISLIFSNNTYISLSTEIIEVTLEDQNKDILND